jgi:hypothetical protein
VLTQAIDNAPEPANSPDRLITNPEDRQYPWNLTPKKSEDKFIQSRHLAGGRPSVSWRSCGAYDDYIETE